jgi:ferredoxin-NADP reductase
LTRDGASNAPIRARLVAVEYAARDTNAYAFARPDGGPLPPATAGAHITLHLPNGMERQYSLLRGEAAPERYWIAVKRDPASRGGSAFVHDKLRVGETLTLDPPRNNFPVVETAEHSVLIAGGVGVTPMVAMARRLQALGRSFEVHYAARSRDDAAFVDELRAAGRLTLHLDQEAGRVFDMAAAVRAAPPDAHLYCCGPNPMLAAFEAATVGRPADCIHVEYFSAREAPDTSGGYVVELARSGRSFEIPPGETILEVLRKAGVDVASSCEEGVCGACETKVLAGVPDHRDVILSPQERAENATIFICCSGAKTDKLVLDL